MSQHDTLTQALQEIADWNSHTTEFAVDYGSNGVRDFYRCIARAALSATQPAAGADVVPEHVALLNEKVRELEARDAFEAQNKCSLGFKRSARGTYVNPPVARDWKWFRLGVQHANKDAS